MMGTMKGPLLASCALTVLPVGRSGLGVRFTSALVLLVAASQELSHSEVNGKSYCSLLPVGCLAAGGFVGSTAGAGAAPAGTAH